MTVADTSKRQRSRVLITPAIVRQWQNKPPQKPRALFDSRVIGFHIRQQPGSDRVMGYIMYPFAKKRRRPPIGPVTPATLDKVRDEAARQLLDVRRGIDVAEVRRAAAARGVTLKSAIDRHLKAVKSEIREKTYEERERYLNVSWKPLHNEPVGSLKRAQIVAVYDRLKEQGPVAADRAVAALNSLYNWLLKRGEVEANPAARLSSNTKPKAHRTLSEAELVEVWHATDDDGDYSRIIRLLLLTGQRRTEIGDLQWSEFKEDGQLIDLPGERTKNGLAHVVPLSPLAMGILRGVSPKLRRLHIFGRGAGGFSGWSKSKARLDARINKAREEKGVPPMPDWDVHDLRRTFTTLMNERGLAQPHHIEAVLNHISGHKASVAGVYNKAQYLDEKRLALQRWADHVGKLIGTTK